MVFRVKGLALRFRVFSVGFGVWVHRLRQNFSINCGTDHP